MADVNRCRHGRPNGLGFCEDKAAEVRWRAAEALGQIGDAAARPALEQVKAKDSDASARISAERALGKLR